MLEPEIVRKTRFQLDKPMESSSNSNTDSKYDEEMQRNDITKFRLPHIQLSYYNSTSKTVTVIEAYDVNLKFSNNDWNQINEFVIVSNLKYFEIGHFKVAVDKDFTKAIKDMINSKKLDNQSFIAFKTNAKLIHSLRSR